MTYILFFVGKPGEYIFMALPEIIILAGNADALRSNFCYRFNGCKSLVANHCCPAKK